jgi:hypothetical protein
MPGTVRMSDKPSPDSSAKSVSSEVSSLSSPKSKKDVYVNQPINLTPGEMAFITNVNKQYEDIQKRVEFLIKIHSTVKSIGKTMQPFGAAIWKRAMKIKHNIEDSFMIAIQPKLTHDIEEQEDIQTILAQLEVAIFEDAFHHFNQDKKVIDLTRDNVKKYIEKNQGEMGKRIELAYRIFYKLQGKNYTCKLPQKIMFVVHALCQDEIDYTDNYTEEQIDAAIEECLHKSSSDIMSESNRNVTGPKSRAIGGPGKLVHDVKKDRWFRVNTDGKKQRITHPAMYGLPTRRNISKLKTKAFKSTRKVKPKKI